MTPFGGRQDRGSVLHKEPLPEEAEQTDWTATLLQTGTWTLQWLTGNISAPQTKHNIDFKQNEN